VTVAIFAPIKSRQLLASSGDPVFDLCRSANGGGGAPLSQAMSSTSVASQTSSAQSLQQPFHPDGNIIVTADYTGQIKVFRQDCAWAFRKFDNSDTSSIRLRGIKGSGSGPRPSGLSNIFHHNPTSSRAGSTRSSSRRNSDAHSIPTNSSQTALSRSLDPTKPAQANGRQTSSSPIRGRTSNLANQSSEFLKPPSSSPEQTRQRSPDPGLMLQEDGQSLAFYRIPVRRESDISRSASVSPERNRRGSISSGHSTDDEDYDHRSYMGDEQRQSTDNNMICKNCGARTFNAFKVQSGGHKGETKLRCSVYVAALIRWLTG
jgi:WD repeat-containing protein 44